MNACTQHLIAIGEALQAYEKKHGDFPQWLSDLHPKYLKDERTLVCPADEEKGIPILPYDEDPNLPVSYEYEIRPEYQAWIMANFFAADLDGNPISLQQYRGKVVLLDFWAVWCGPCIGEMPNVKKVYDAYKSKGFDVIGVSFDNDEVELREYLKVCNIPWRQIFDGQDGSLKKQYGIGGIPSPWLIDREGKLISFSARGTTLWQLVAEAVKKA